MDYLLGDGKSTLLFLFLSFNMITFLFCSYDKYISRFHKVSLRIPEKTFFVLGFTGGAPGICFAMLLWRHKTRHIQFMIFFPVASLCQVGLLIFTFSHLL
jgi:uncharacterized membrane protein YsdA (DUF1294 family)